MTRDMKLYESKKIAVSRNEFEFCCASRAFENHFVNSKGA